MEPSSPAPPASPPDRARGEVHALQVPRYRQNPVLAPARLLRHHHRARAAHRRSDSPCPDLRPRGCAPAGPRGRRGSTRARPVGGSAARSTSITAPVSAAPPPGPRPPPDSPPAPAVHPALEQPALYAPPAGDQAPLRVLEQPLSGSVNESTCIQPMTPYGPPRRPSSTHSTLRSCRPRAARARPCACRPCSRPSPACGRTPPVRARGQTAAHPCPPSTRCGAGRASALARPSRDRIEKSDVLEAGAALALAAVGHDDVIKGLIPRPAPRQANRYHASYRSRVVKRGRGTGPPKKSADSTQSGSGR